MIIILLMLMLILSIKLSKIDNPFLNMLRKYQGPLGILGGVIVLVYFIYTDSGNVFLMFPGMLIVAGLIQWNIDVKKRKLHNKNLNHNE